MLVFEEQECNSPRFCLAATHPTNEKMPTFKRAGAFLNSRCGRFGAETHVGSQLMDFLNVFRFFHSFLHTFEVKARLAYSDHAALLTYCSVPYIQLRLVLISLPGHRKLFCARLSRCSLVRFIAKVYCGAF